MAKDLMNLLDLTKEELREVLDLAHKYREDRTLDNDALSGKTIGSFSG